MQKTENGVANRQTFRAEALAYMPRLRKKNAMAGQVLDVIIKTLSDTDFTDFTDFTDYMD